MSKFTSLITACAASLVAFGAQAAVVDFEGDAVGPKANGFVSGGVTFTDTIGAELNVISGYPVECASAANKCLAVFGDDTSALQMDFDGAYTNLQLDFGNDNPGFIPVGGLALLQMYLHGVLVGEASVVANVDDFMNQTISYSGAAFDRAVFAYTDAAKNRVNLIEVVDNIAYSGRGTVPEPASLALLGVALLGAGVARRRASKV